MKLFFYCISAIYFNFFYWAVQLDGWQLLANVKIEKRWDELLQKESEKPIFGESLQKAEGKKIVLKGYMIPLENLIIQESFVLSALPYQTCFFCGGAGPETVALIETVSDVKYTEKLVTVTGVLELNSSDPLQLYYIIKEAEVEK